MTDYPRVRAARSLAEVCAQIRAAHPDVPWRIRQCEPRAGTMPWLPDLIRYCRSGMTTADIGTLMGITKYGVRYRIQTARSAGRWPADLVLPSGKRPRRAA